MAYRPGQGTDGVQGRAGAMGLGGCTSDSSALALADNTPSSAISSRPTVTPRQFECGHCAPTPIARHVG